MLNFLYALPFPTRLKPWGTLTCAAQGAVGFAGTDGRRTRYCFIIANKDSANPLELRSSNHVSWTTIWPSVTLAFFIADDIEVYNPHASASVQYQVGELFLDEGMAVPSGGRATQFGPQGGVPAGGGSSPGGGGGAPSGGGSYSGGGSGYTGGGGSGSIKAF